jgi:hypothetical protein
MQIVRLNDCGNAPKNGLVESLTIALYMKDREFLMSYVLPETLWEYPMNRIGEQEPLRDLTSVSEPVIDGMEKMDRCAFSRLEIVSAITHGKVGSVEVLWSSEAGEVLREALFFTFRTAKADKLIGIRSYRM